MSLRLDPRHIASYKNLATTYSELMKKREDAIRVLRDAIRVRLRERESELTPQTVPEELSLYKQLIPLLESSLDTKMEAISFYEMALLKFADKPDEELVKSLVGMCTALSVASDPLSLFACRRMAQGDKKFLDNLLLSLSMSRRQYSPHR